MYLFANSLTLTVDTISCKPTSQQ